MLLINIRLWQKILKYIFLVSVFLFLILNIFIFAAFCLYIHASATCRSLSRLQHAASYVVTSVILFLDWKRSQTNVIATNTIINRFHPETSSFKSLTKKDTGSHDFLLSQHVNYYKEVIACDMPSENSIK